MVSCAIRVASESQGNKLRVRGEEACVVMGAEEGTAVAAAVEAPRRGRGCRESYWGLSGARQPLPVSGAPRTMWIMPLGSAHGPRESEFAVGRVSRSWLAWAPAVADGLELRPEMEVAESCLRTDDRRQED